MLPIIKILPQKKLIGISMSMSLTNNKTSDLWRNFITRRNEIENAVGTDLFSMQLYTPDYFKSFDLNREFVKWAAVEVNDFDGIPPGMNAFELSGGLYAVFHYQGESSKGAAIFQYIFGTWLPNSEYELDNRPHFELLGEKYRNNDPSSEEDIWVPIKPKD
ncbi:MAG: GyrI-like domain-containing protein [Bacteroidetes bacterium]|nr:GyrI-like domain-containing protein [Bacteroidota bacterium]